MFSTAHKIDCRHKKRYPTLNPFVFENEKPPSFQHLTWLPLDNLPSLTHFLLSQEGMDPKKIEAILVLAIEIDFSADIKQLIVAIGLSLLT